MSRRKHLRSTCRRTIISETPNIAPLIIICRYSSIKKPTNNKHIARIWSTRSPTAIVGKATVPNPSHGQTNKIKKWILDLKDKCLSLFLLPNGNSITCVGMVWPCWAFAGGSLSFWFGGKNATIPIWPSCCTSTRSRSLVNCLENLSKHLTLIVLDEILIDFLWFRRIFHLHKFKNILIWQSRMLHMKIHAKD